MGISVSEVLAKSIPLEADFAGGTVKFDYRPHAMTPEREAMLAKVEESADPNGSLFDQFCLIVAGWDLVWKPGDKKPIELKPENLRRVPTELLMAILARIKEHLSPPLPEPETPGSFT
jgi:hypothetical protein